MATIYRALACAALVLYAFVVTTGLDAGDGSQGLAVHLRVGLLGAVVGCLVNSVPFAYFLGTRFWVKAFVRASGAGDEWNRRHDLWMQDRAYPVMYLAAFFPAGAAIAGGLADSGRVAAAWHTGFVAVSIALQATALVLTPRSMKRNSALMDRLADEHSIPQPDSPERATPGDGEQADALPPLFQLSRVLIWLGANLLLIWLYLHFGTESWRASPLLPFALGCCALVSIGVGLNARFDPSGPATAPKAWARGLVTGVVGVVLALWMRRLGL